MHVQIFCAVSDEVLRSEVPHIFYAASIISIIQSFSKATYTTSSMCMVMFYFMYNKLFLRYLGFVKVFKTSF